MQFLSGSWWLVLIGLLLLGVSYFIMVWKSSNEVSKSVKYAVWILRLLSTLILLLFLAQPYFSITSKEIQKPVLFVAFDYSESMKPFAEQVDQLKNRFDNGDNEIIQKYDVQLLSFGNVTKPYNTQYSKSTNYAAINSYVQTTKSDEYTQLLIVTDGIYNQGQNPLHMQSWNYPVHTIAIGDTTIKKDVAIQEVRSNKTVFKGNEVPVVVTIGSQLLKGVKATVAISEKGKNLFSESFTIQTNDEVTEILAMIDLTEIGIHSLSVSVSVNENEPKKNNKTTVYVKVQDTKKKIICIAEAPHPDVRMLLNAWSKTPEYDVQVRYGFENVNAKDFKNIDLIVLHKPTNATKLKYNEFIDKNPTWWITGSSVDRPLWKNFKTGVLLNTANSQTNMVSFSWNSAVNLFNMQSEWVNDLNNAAPIEVPFGKYSVQAGIDVLVHQQIGSVPTTYPLLSIDVKHKIKKGIWIGEGYWKWQLNTFNVEQEKSACEQLVLQFTRLMLTKENKEPLVCYSPQSILEGENWKLTANVFNANFEPSSEARVTLSIKDSMGVPFSFDPIIVGNDYNFLVKGLYAGDYTYEVTSVLNKEESIIKGKLLVKSINLEQFNSRANFGLLRKWSAQTNGLHATSNTTDSLLSQLIKTAPPSIILEQKKQKSILELWWLLFIPVVFLGAEWFIRKRSGMV
jgi:hypothetical protein